MSHVPAFLYSSKRMNDATTAIHKPPVGNHPSICLIKSSNDCMLKPAAEIWPALTKITSA
jgi:hypothetical protein